MVRSRTHRGKGRQAQQAANRLLAALPRAELERLRPALEPVELELRQLLFDVDRDIEHVYFPVSGVVSIVGPALDGYAVEVATVGKEGFLGVPVVLGARKTNLQAFSQVPGAALRITSDELRRELARGGALRGLLDLYTQALFTQVAQSSACNRLHGVGERCARWLLSTHDRVEADTFFLTHDFLAQMLGVRRASVSEVAARLQARGLIRYARGEMRITDRRGLESAACECYAIIRSEFDRLLGNGASTQIVQEVRRAASVNGQSRTHPPGARGAKREA